MRRGQALVEYCLIVCLLGCVLIASMVGMRTVLSHLWGQIATNVVSGVTPTPVVSVIPTPTPFPTCTSKSDDENCVEGGKDD